MWCLFVYLWSNATLFLRLTGTVLEMRGWLLFLANRVTTLMSPLRKLTFKYFINGIKRRTWEKNSFDKMGKRGIDISYENMSWTKRFKRYNIFYTYSSLSYIYIILSVSVLAILFLDLLISHFNYCMRVTHCVSCCHFYFSLNLRNFVNQLQVFSKSWTKKKLQCQ